MVLGDGGIIAQARLAMQIWENASTAEEQSLNELLEEYEQAMEGTGEDTDDNEEEETCIEIEIQTVDSEGNILSGAEYILYNVTETGDYSNTIEGKYLSETETWTFEVEAGKEYALEQTVTVDGYNLLTSAIVFTVTEDGELELTNGVANGNVITITLSTGSALPS